jgi:hypothetical integral membrane protein (TIGR02206 family)
VSAFRLFGPSHLVALGATLVATAALTAWVRRDPQRIQQLGPVLAAVLASAGIGFVIIEAVIGTPWRAIAPLHICDVAVFIGAFALVTRRQLACELLYFWGCAGTVGALLTPDLGEDFPHYRFLLYFLQHGTIVVAALVVVVGVGLRPRPRGPLIAWLWLNLYGAFIAVLDQAFDANFMYLCKRPGSASPLDWFGPWPQYVAMTDLLALALFALLGLPFYKARGAPPPMPARRAPPPPTAPVRRAPPPPKHR